MGHIRRYGCIRIGLRGEPLNTDLFFGNTICLHRAFLGELKSAPEYYISYVLVVILQHQTNVRKFHNIIGCREIMSPLVSNEVLEQRLKFLCSSITKFVDEPIEEIYHSFLDSEDNDIGFLQEVKSQIVQFITLENREYHSLRTSLALSGEQNTSVIDFATFENIEFLSEYFCTIIWKMIEQGVSYEHFVKDYPSLQMLDDLSFRVEPDESSTVRRSFVWLMAARGQIESALTEFDAPVNLNPLRTFVENLDDNAHETYSILLEIFDPSALKRWVVDCFVNGKEFLNFTKWLIRSDWENEQNVEHTFMDMYGEFDFEVFQKWLNNEIMEHGGFLSYNGVAERFHSTFSILYHAKNSGYNFTDFRNSDCGKFLLKSGLEVILEEIEA